MEWEPDPNFIKSVTKNIFLTPILFFVSWGLVPALNSQTSNWLFHYVLLAPIRSENERI